MPPWIGYSRFSPSVYVSESDTDSLVERIRQLTAVEDQRRCQEERQLLKGKTMPGLGKSPAVPAFLIPVPGNMDPSIVELGRLPLPARMFTAPRK